MGPKSTTPAAGVSIDLAALLAVLAREMAPHVARELAAQAPPTAAPSPAPLVDKREAARSLGVSPATIDRLDREGQPFIRIGDVKRYDLVAVLAWHRERSAQGAEASTVSPSSAPEAATGVRCLSHPRTGKGAR